MIARILTELAIDKDYDYKIPKEMSSLIKIGSRVTIPFRNTIKDGVVIGFRKYSKYELKDILSIKNENPLIPENLIKLGNWMSTYYCCSTEQAIRALLPGVVRSGKIKPKKEEVLLIADNINLDEEINKIPNNAKKQIKILKTLAKYNSYLLSDLRKDFKVTKATLSPLLTKKILYIEERYVDRDPFAKDIIVKSNDKILTEEQKNAVNLIVDSIINSRSDVFLIHGVTGSGKTEVYMQSLRRCIEKGQEAIVLVPEISLTPQTSERFRSRFGEQVSVMHSGLTSGERFDEWNKINSARVSIVVGARSALFAPFKNLGLIIVDEEHETTYKQEEAPRYQARDVAVMRGKMENATIVLGSATPSFESRNNVKLGKYKIIHLNDRIAKKPMPEIRLVDLKLEAEIHGIFSYFSNTLIEKVKGCLIRNEQVILFLNRRGFATNMVCNKCGFNAECKYCSTTLTYHKKDETLICHLCGDTKRAYIKCPGCADKEIRYTGTGTERIEEIAEKIFKGAVIARMDSDTMKTSTSYKRVLNAFNAGKVDILIGTQMIAKGLDFPKVTLVGIINGDSGLNIPDFRASEKVFQLITQVSGRCGRGVLKGEVVIQTFSPLNSALQHAIKYQYEKFFKEEMQARDLFKLPPYSRMAMVHFRGPDELYIEKIANEFYIKFKKNLPSDTYILPPTPAPIAKIKSKYRYQIFIRTPNILRVSSILRKFTVGIKMNKKVHIYVDIDPYSML